MSTVSTLPRALAWLCLALCFMLQPAIADDAAGQLATALQDVKSLRGNFLQRQFATDGELVQESRGSFRLLRPGYFAWQIDSPERQLIIADPEYIWHHDIELETVTRRPVAGNDAATPLQILGGDETTLKDNYTVTSSGAGQFTLVPKLVQAPFRDVAISLAGDKLTRMQIRDNTGQTVEISFDGLDTSSLAAADFLFVPPEEADIFYYDQ